MGLSTKHVSGDHHHHQGFDWPAGKATGPPELPKTPPARRPPPQQPEQLKCPRCGSTNTKFCYYNNYNKSQPRHFCKACKRHWTKGGTLRNVPVGGGRKNKRPKVLNAARPAQDRPDFPLSANTGNNNNNNDSNNNHQKSMSNILYHALIGSPLLHEKSDNMNISINVPLSSTVLNVSAPQGPNTHDFDHFSSLCAFDTNLSSSQPITYHESLNGFDHCPGNLEYSMEESSTVTTVNNNNIPSTSSTVPWPGPDTGGCLGFPDYWNWSEIDGLNSSDHLNISWDDEAAEIKP